MIIFLNQVEIDALLRQKIKQMKEEKDDEIKNITEKYETAVKKLSTELNDASQQIQTLMDEKVKFTFYISVPLS